MCSAATWRHCLRLDAGLGGGPRRPSGDALDGSGSILEASPIILPSPRSIDREPRDASESSSDSRSAAMMSRAAAAARVGEPGVSAGMRTSGPEGSDCSSEPCRVRPVAPSSLVPAGEAADSGDSEPPVTHRFPTRSNWWGSGAPEVVGATGALPVRCPVRPDGTPTARSSCWSQAESAMKPGAGCPKLCPGSHREPHPGGRAPGRLDSAPG